MTTLGYLRAAREWASPVLKKSAFMEKGVLTPEEFVKAGDELVFRCPTWSWESGDPKWAKPYLPKDKQYLITRRIPCQKRVAEMENMTTDAADDDDDGDWMLSHLIQDKPLEDEFDILDQEGEVMEKTESDNAVETEGQDEYADMADFEDDNVLQDDVAATTTATSHNEEESNLIKVRTYDVSISYDKYYQTPRVWMLGYDAEGQPLTGKQMLEDVISDYANRTVTIEAHPHVAGPHASIHPCKHGMVMKAIVRNLIKANSGDGDEGPSIEMYLFIFLKFVSSIIPTINYDFTMDVRADTRK
jgi:ubiquitin-like-conjugating enzyme ATG3